MPRAVVVVAGLLLSATALPAQNTEHGTQPPYEPTLVFSLNFGLTTNGDLWTVPKQPQPVLGVANTYDTLALGRVLRPGLTGGLAATLFFKPNVGATAEVTYFGTATEQRCSNPRAYVPDSAAIGANGQACTNGNGEHVTTSVIGFLIGVAFRTSPTAKIQPNFRATFGPGLIGNSFVQTGGFVYTTGACSQGCRLVLLDENSHPEFTYVASFSAGVAYRLTSAYRVRFDARDLITGLPVAIGPHPVNTNIAPTGTRMKHITVFTFGFDMSLERRRARRY